jgi:hypothetical protein
VQIIAQVKYYGNSSLRKTILRDRKLKDYGLCVERHKTSGRNPGWAKLIPDDYVTPGVINLEWGPQTWILTARVITKGPGSADKITGLFISYLLGSHKKKIQSILIHPE